MQQDSESQPEPESLILFGCWLSLTKLKLKHLQMFLQSAICNLQTHFSVATKSGGTQKHVFGAQSNLASLLAIGVFV